MLDQHSRHRVCFQVIYQHSVRTQHGSVVLSYESTTKSFSPASFKCCSKQEGTELTKTYFLGFGFSVVRSDWAKRTNNNIIPLFKVQSKLGSSDAPELRIVLCSVDIPVQSLCAVHYVRARLWEIKSRLYCISTHVVSSSSLGQETPMLTNWPQPSQPLMSTVFLHSDCRSSEKLT